MKFDINKFMNPPENEFDVDNDKPVDVSVLTTNGGIFYYEKAKSARLIADGLILVIELGNGKGTTLYNMEQVIRFDVR